MGTFRFTCPSCGAAVAVDEGARSRLLSAGCAVCGATVDESAFARGDGIKDRD